VAIRTVGHGNLAADELGLVLTDAGVDLVVDIRRRPASRRHPQFNRADLERWLPEYGVAYEWQEVLGGHREPHPASPHSGLDGPFRGYADHMTSAGFAAGLDHLVAAATDRTVAVMCAESDWHRCHRRLLADALVLLRRAEVRHLGHDVGTEPHHPSASARVADGRLVYDVGHTATLFG
jgi:uncharacterized protein (DUF488 family)